MAGKDFFDSIYKGTVVNEHVLAYTVDWHSSVCDADLLKDGSRLNKWLFTNSIWNSSGKEEVTGFLCIGGECIVPGDDLWLLVATHCAVKLSSEECGERPVISGWCWLVRYLVGRKSRKLVLCSNLLFISFTAGPTCLDHVTERAATVLNLLDLGLPDK